MPNKTYPVDLLEQAQAVLAAWQQIDPALTLGNLSQARMDADLNQTQPLQARMSALQAELLSLRDQHDALYNTIWDHVKRVRSAVKGIYGDDSPQYQMVGGTRKSDRKRPARKAAAPPAPPAPAQTE
jgi:hypothetical protein